MRGDAAERAVIAAGIEASHVEVPVVAGEDQEVRLRQPPPSLLETSQQPRVSFQSSALWLFQELFVQRDDAVRVCRFVYRSKPVLLVMPLAQPLRAIFTRDRQCGI